MADGSLEETSFINYHALGYKKGKDPVVRIQSMIKGYLARRNYRLKLLINQR